MLSAKESRKLVSNFMRAAVNHFGHHVDEDLLRSWDLKVKELTKMIKTGRYINPKGPISSYILYCQKIRPELTENNPGMKPREIMLLMGQRWNELKSSTKPEDRDLMKDLEDQAKVLKEKYLREKDKEIVRPKAPAHPNSPYRIFSLEQKGQSLRVINEKWKGVKNDPEMYQEYVNRFEEYKKAQTAY